MSSQSVWPSHCKLHESSKEDFSCTSVLLSALKTVFTNMAMARSHKWMGPRVTLTWIIILDGLRFTLNFTSPAEKNINIRNTEKSNKYAHFTTDITQLSCKVNCFEVSIQPETILHWTHSTRLSNQTSPSHNLSQTSLPCPSQPPTTSSCARTSPPS